MKFLVDAQLPYVLTEYIRDKNFDVLHTNDLPAREKTTDNEILLLSAQENRIIISKDMDFFDGYILNNSPKKLLWITTGNIKNKELIHLFQKNFDKIADAFITYSLIELDNEKLIIHE